MLCWKSWDELRKPKDKGGMVFEISKVLVLYFSPSNVGISLFLYYLLWLNVSKLSIILLKIYRLLPWEVDPLISGKASWKVVIFYQSV